MILTPLPLLSALFFLIGVMSILMGLLAEMMVRTYFESQHRPPTRCATRSTCRSASVCAGSLASPAPATEADLRAMSAALSHRGPDGAGAPHRHRLRVGLGHRRLAIIDPEGGHQPMWNEDGSVAVVFNGEIYNTANCARN